MVGPGSWDVHLAPGNEGVTLGVIAGSPELLYQFGAFSGQAGVALHTGLYPNTVDPPEPGRPRLYVSMHGEACNGPLVGTFRVDELRMTGDGGLASFAAAFEAFCYEGQTNPVPLQGCVRYAPGSK